MTVSSEFSNVLIDRNTGRSIYSLPRSKLWSLSALHILLLSCKELYSYKQHLLEVYPEVEWKHFCGPCGRYAFSQTPPIPVLIHSRCQIERHPLVLHLPAPHMWELTPSPVANDFSDPARNKLVVTIELHVRKDLDDNEVLSLTRWAHDRVRLALNLGSRSKDHDEDSEVTVGIVRG